MNTAAALAAVMVAAFAWYAPRRAAALPPRTATWLLTLGAVVCTAVTGSVLALLAATAVARLPVVAAITELSPTDMRSTDPVPVWLAWVCAGLLTASMAMAVRHAIARIIALRRLHRDCHGLGPAGSLHGHPRVTVLDSEHPEAYATPAGGGRIVVTTGLLAALNEREQRVLLAHETAHLRYRHAWWVFATDLCAAANPALLGVARATAQATERWADEVAAAAVGDRETAARAVARAALHVHGTSPHRLRPVVAAVGGQVPQRVRALLSPPPRPQRALTAVLALLLAVGIGSTFTVQRRTDTYFDTASTDRPAATAVYAVHHSGQPTHGGPTTRDRLHRMLHRSLAQL
jgi:Zn-dependent protease with chaperone function